MTKPTKNLTIRLSEQEMAILERYCQIHFRTKSDVLRELIRSLSNYEYNELSLFNKISLQNLNKST